MFAISDPCFKLDLDQLDSKDPKDPKSKLLRRLVRKNSSDNFFKDENNSSEDGIQISLPLKNGSLALFSSDLIDDNFRTLTHESFNFRVLKLSRYPVSIQIAISF